MDLFLFDRDIRWHHWFWFFKVNSGNTRLISKFYAKLTTIYFENIPFWYIGKKEKYPENNLLFKANNRNSRTMWEICFQLTTF